MRLPVGSLNQRGLLAKSLARVSLGKGYGKRSPTSWVTFFIMANIWSLSLTDVLVKRRESNNPIKPPNKISISFNKPRRRKLLQRFHRRFRMVTRRGGKGLRGGRGRGLFAITLFLCMLSPPRVKNGESHADTAHSAVSTVRGERSSYIRSCFASTKRSRMSGLILPEAAASHLTDPTGNPSDWTQPMESKQFLILFNHKMIQYKINILLFW